MTNGGPADRQTGGPFGGPAGRRRGLALIAYGFLIAALACGVRLAGRQVRSAADDLLRAEAAVAARVFEATRDSTVLPGLLGDRWRLVAGADESLEEAAVRPAGRGGRMGVAAVHDADGWYVVGRLEVSADRRTGGPTGRGAWIAALLAAVIAAPVVWRWSRPGPAWRAALLATGVLAVPLGLADRHAIAALRGLTDVRLALGRAAVEAHPDPAALRAQAGGVQRLTGIPFIPLEGVEGAAELVSGLPSGAVLDLRAGPPGGPPVRRSADRITYAVADVAGGRLVQLPYEHTHRPAPRLALIAAVGLALAALAAALARLADERRTFGRTVAAWSFLAPAALHLAVFTVGPLAFAAWLSLHRWSLLDAARPFVGLDNYRAVLSDPSWWNAIRNTVLFTLHVPAAMALALGLALLTHRRIRGVVVLRAVFFLPTITSLVAVAIVWQWMLHSEYGLFNAALGVAGLGPVPWLSSPRTALVALMLMAVWLVVGYQMVLFQAGLAAIPEDLYDAARMDGAGPWRRFVHVTLPGLRPTLFFVLVTSVIGSFQLFGAVYVMTEGGPLHATDVAVFHIYEEAWEYFRFGRAAAMSWILFALIFAVTWLQFRAVERRVAA